MPNRAPVFNQTESITYLLLTGENTPPNHSPRQTNLPALGKNYFHGASKPVRRIRPPLDPAAFLLFPQGIRFSPNQLFIPHRVCFVIPQRSGGICFSRPVCNLRTAFVLSFAAKRRNPLVPSCFVISAPRLFLSFRSEAEESASRPSGGAASSSPRKQGPNQWRLQPRAFRSCAA